MPLQTISLIQKKYGSLVISIPDCLFTAYPLETPKSTLRCTFSGFYRRGDSLDDVDNTTNEKNLLLKPQFNFSATEELEVATQHVAHFLVLEKSEMVQKFGAIPGEWVAFNVTHYTIFSRDKFSLRKTKKVNPVFPERDVELIPNSITIESQSGKSGAIR